MKFTELQLSPKVIRAVAEMGFEEATTVQAKTVPLIMQGKDVIGHSQTGTGKTAAFGIPAIEMCDPRSKDTQVLVLCPTRELAVQSCDEIRKFAKFMHGIKAVPVYGGQHIDYQIKALKQGAQIVIGTPGRIMDHMRRKTLKFSTLKMVVLDEADEMLNMGFREDIETILKQTPQERQTVLFSATMSREILNITRNYQNNPEHIKVVPRELTIPAIEQVCLEVDRGAKQDAINFILEKYKPKLTLVFCNTKRQVDELSRELGAMGYLVEGIHGDMNQSARLRALKAFKSGRTDILVATDVAARGIDVEGIEAVINYDIPQDMEYYVHRIGRTGRAGKSGMAFTFAAGRRQMVEISQIQKFTGAKMKIERVHKTEEDEGQKIEAFMEEVKKNVRSRDLSGYLKIVEMLSEEGLEPEKIAAALTGMMLEGGRDAKNRKQEVFSSEGNRRRERSSGQKNAEYDKNAKRGGRRAYVVSD